MWQEVKVRACRALRGGCKRMHLAHDPKARLDPLSDLLGVGDGPLAIGWREQRVNQDVHAYPEPTSVITPFAFGQQAYGTRARVHSSAGYFLELVRGRKVVMVPIGHNCWSGLHQAIPPHRMSMPPQRQKGTGMIVPCLCASIISSKLIEVNPIK